MNKLKFNILVAAVAATGVLTSCSESWLDSESKIDPNSETAYSRESDAYRALIGCYDAYRRTHVSFSFPLVSEFMSDQCFAGMGASDITPRSMDRFDISFSPSDQNILSELWSAYYTVIYRCNVLLDRAPNIEWTDKEGLYLGQTRALRACAYFEAVRLWGNIPLFLEPVNENRPQAPIDEVYQAIFEDLYYACENIPADAYPKSEAATNDGHLTADAAKALLARAWLYYTGRYGKEPAVEGLDKAYVLNGLEDIIASGSYDLVPEFKNLWAPASVKVLADAIGFDLNASTYAGDGNCETVFAVKFSTLGTWNADEYGNGENYGNRWLVMVGTRNFAPVKANLDVPLGTGWGALTVNPKFVKSFAPNDSRLAASIVDYAGEKITLASDWSTCFNDTKDFTGYANRKYAPMAFYDGSTAAKAEGGGDMQIHQHQDFVVVRYADVLLMAAELGSGNALAYLNRVAERAYGDKNHYAAATKEAIMAERNFEFAFEGIHYWDLLRQGLDYAASQLKEPGLTVTDLGVETTYTVNSDNFLAKEGYSQIPGDQITNSNGVLKQNPGW